MSETSSPGTNRSDDDFRLIGPSGAPVVRPDRLDAKSRARAMAPSGFTFMNMLLGYASIRAALDSRLHLAAVLILVAIVFDIFDGAVARAVGAITPFGLQFDSLADLISFGVAPATLLYAWSLDDLQFAGRDLHVVGWAISGFWLGCAAFRLARFNVTVDPAGDKRYFIGLASPGAAGVVLASVLAFDGDFAGWTRVFPIAIAIVPAALMVSPFRFTSFRFIASPRPDKVWLSVLVALALIAGLLLAPAPTLVVVAYGYVSAAPLGWLTRPLRTRLFGLDSVAPPRKNLPSVFFLVDERERPDREERATPDP
ncbi:MAG: CDP-diacylglycerol--serine O-phosphatidyltransferase [Acidimicrobiales bacterium]